MRNSGFKVTLIPIPSPHAHLLNININKQNINHRFLYNKALYFPQHTKAKNLKTIAK